MLPAFTKSSRIVGVSEAETKFSALLDAVERGQEITITRHGRRVARLTSAGQPSLDHSVFTRIRALRARLSLGTGETAGELVAEGRRAG